MGSEYIAPATRKMGSIVQSEVGFIYNSWLKSYRSSKGARDIPDPQYYEGQAAIVRKLLDRSLVLEVRSDRNPDWIGGYLVAEANQGRMVVHYVYLKSLWRRRGLGTALLAEASSRLGVPVDGGIFTHALMPGQRFLQSRGLSFNPEKIR